MDKRAMKKRVKQEIATFLCHALNEPEPPELLQMIRLWVFKDRDNPTEAESRRLHDILFELHREAHEYEV